MRSVSGLAGVCLLLSSVSMAGVQFEYSGTGQSFSDAGSSDVYEGGVIQIPSERGSHYSFYVVERGEKHVYDCFMLLQDELHENSTDRYQVLAPESPSHCGNDETYRKVGWAHAWSNEQTWVSYLIVIPNGSVTVASAESKEGYVAFNITTSLTEDRKKELLEIAGLAIKDSTPQTLNLYWNERYWRTIKP